MPIHKVDGGYKWGKSGKVYPSKEGAVKQMKAIYANGWKGHAQGGLVELIKQRQKLIVSGIVVCLLFFGCTSTRDSTRDTTAIATTGSAAVGRIEQLNQQLADISERERQELDRITGTTHDLAATIQQLVGFANGLLDEIDRLRDTLASNAENTAVSDNRIRSDHNR